MNWIRQLFTRRQLHKDLSEEIEQHIEEKADDLVQGGLSRDEAIARARREFGNVTLLTERGRDVWRWPLEDFFSDVRFAVRQLCKSPAFAVAAVLTLALGIGTNTAVFSVVNAVILRPLAYPESERLISVKSLHLRGVPQPSDLKTVLFGVAPYSPLLLGVACLVVACAGGLAAYLPARRAVSIDPMHALRSE